MNNSTPTNSPPRRREEFSAEISPVTKNEAAWTVAQCNRLLRPLSSNIAALHKLKTLESERGDLRKRSAEAGVHNDSDGSDSSFSSVSSGAKRSREGLERLGGVLDCNEWEDCMGPKKKIKRTYSSKNRTTRVQNPRINFVSDRSIALSQEFKLEIPRQLRATAQRDGGRPEDQQEKSGHESMDEDKNGLHTFSKNSSKPKGDIRVSVPPGKSEEQAKLIANVLSGLMALLKKTHSQTEAQRQYQLAGSRSLFSTCLRMVPEYVAEEEHWSKTQNPDEQVDVSSAIYDELENFGSSGGPGTGWKPMRTVVRLHGIHLLSDAIKSGVIDLAGARSIVHLCINQSAPDEAQILLGGILSHVERDDQPLQDHNRPWMADREVSILDIVEEFAYWSGRFGYVFRTITKLFEEDRLPTSWLSSRIMASCLNGAMESLSLGDNDSHRDDDHAWQAALLLRTVVRKAYAVEFIGVSEQVHNLRGAHHTSKVEWPVQDMSPLVDSRESSADLGDVLPDVQIRYEKRGNSLHRISTSVLTILSAITMLQHEKQDIHHGQCRQPCLTILQEIGLEARQLWELTSDSERVGDSEKLGHHLMMLPLLAAGLATRIAQERILPSMTPISLDIPELASLAIDQITVQGAGSFLNDISRHVGGAFTTQGGNGRAYKRTSFAYLEAMIKNLNDASTVEGTDSQSQKFLNDIRVAAALAFCAEGCEMAHMEWALDLEQDAKMSADSSLIRTPARAASQSKHSYRWEEGIAEWVTRTPIAPPSSSSTPSPKTLASSFAHRGIPTPVSIPSPKQPVQRGIYGHCLLQQPLSGISPKVDGAESDPEPALTTSKGAGHTTMQCVRIKVDRTTTSGNNEDAWCSSQASQHSSPQPRASDPFQMIDESSSDSNADEQSAPQDWSQSDRTSQRLGVKRQVSQEAIVQPLVSEEERRILNLSINFPPTKHSIPTNSRPVLSARIWSWRRDGPDDDDTEDELSLS